eukprot:2659951-Amphidinium_carterae.1
MESKTTFKCTRQRIITDKTYYKAKRFHDFNIITTGEYYNADYTMTITKCYYSDEQKNKSQQPPCRQRFVRFMINKHRDDMRKLITRAGSTAQEIRETYANHYEGGPAQQRDKNHKI